MNTTIHLGSYLTHFFLECDMFQTKVVEKIKTRILCSITFYFKSYRFWDMWEKYFRAKQATDDNLHMHIACWIPKATNTHSDSSLNLCTGRPPIGITIPDVV